MRALLVHRRAAGVGLLGSVLLAGCSASVAGGGAASLPTVAASPAATPTPPRTAPPTAALTPSTPHASGSSTTGAPRTPTTGPRSAPPATAAPSVPPGASIAPSAGTSSDGSTSASGPAGPCTEARLSVRTDSSTYPLRRAVRITATLMNAGPATCTVQSSAERGFTVSDSRGPVWRSGCSSTPAGHRETVPCARFISLIPLAPGERLVRSQDWSQQTDGSDRQVAPGSYHVSESWAGQFAEVTVTLSAAS